MKRMRVVSAVVLASFLLVAYGCKQLLQPEDLGAPVPGNAGVLTVTNVQPTSVDLAWGKANDDKSKQQDLEYKAVYSESDNIASLDGVSANGTVAMNWTRDVDQTHITGLTAGTDYYFNVLVRDGSNNEASYVMTVKKAEQAPADTTAKAAPIPGNGGTLVLSDVQPSSLTLSWAPASDNTTQQADLEYRVVMSSADNIATVTDAQTNGDQLLDWTADTTSVDVSGLSPEAVYYFNVLVRDTSGLAAAYTMTSRAPTSTSDTTNPEPGNGGILTVSQIQETSLLLSWMEATDDVTPQTDLEYRVLMSTQDNIADVPDANVNGTVLVDWTAAQSTAGLGGLEAGTTYYFNVLVRDAAGNVASYVRTETTTVSAESPKLIWADKDRDIIYSANLDGTGIDTLLSDYRLRLDSPNYLTIDRARRKLYVSDWGMDRIIRMGIDGSNPEVVVSNPDVDGPVGMGFDNTGDRLFFLDQYTDRIQRSAPDGSLIEQLVTGVLNTGYGMAVDDDTHEMYWTDWGDTLIYSASLAGTNINAILNSADGIIRPLGLALDSQAHQLYFTDAVNQTIYRVNTDGTGLLPIIDTGLQFPITCALDVSAGKLYWADPNTKLIERSDLDGSNRETVFDFNGTVAAPYAVTIWRP